MTALSEAVNAQYSQLEAANADIEAMEAEISKVRARCYCAPCAS